MMSTSGELNKRWRRADIFRDIEQSADVQLHEFLDKNEVIGRRQQRRQGGNSNASSSARSRSRASSAASTEGFIDSSSSTSGRSCSNSRSRRRQTLPPPLPLFKLDERVDDTPASVSNLPPRTGLAHLMMEQPPEHLDRSPGFDEPFHSAVADLTIERMRALDMQRLEHPEDVLERVAYDCFDTNPQTRDRELAPQQPGELPPYYVLNDANDTTLVFESRFECGNLRRAIQIYEFEYDLVLHPDVNTNLKSHVQWFYFRVNNMRPGNRYKFNLINYVKNDALFNTGMRPLMYSEIRARLSGVGWRRAGEDICYYQNNVVRKKNRPFFTLTFTATPEHANDTVYFAYSYPFSYTTLQGWLGELENESARRQTFRRRTFCQTLAGNGVDLLTISDFENPKGMKSRKGVVVTARVHPGESNASWVMKGFVDFLTGSTDSARELRRKFVFKVVPMLNPDGVINGNYRCSLAGVDLNRMWLDPSKKLHPTIFSTKQLLKRMKEDREVTMFIDIHGHSRKHNVFIYGCENDGAEELRLRERIFPRMLWRCADNFSFQSCSFKVPKSKESTARVVVRRELDIVNSYTLETSFSGADFGPNRGYHFHQSHLMSMGRSLCEALLDYSEESQTHFRMALEELRLLYPTLPTEQGSSGGDDGGSDGDYEVSKTKLSKKSTKKRMKLKTKLAKKQARLNKKESEATSSEKAIKKVKRMLSSAISLGIPPATEDVLLPVGRIEAGERPRSRKTVRSARKGSVASVPNTLSSASSTTTTKITLLGSNVTKSSASNAKSKSRRKSETVSKGGKKKKRNKNNKKQASTNNNYRKGSQSTSAPLASPSNTKAKESSSAKSRQKKATPRLGSGDSSCKQASSALVSEATFCPTAACADTPAVTTSVEAPDNAIQQTARLDPASARLPPLPARMTTNSNGNISQIRA